jgi:ABC-type glycerol-3-phosphate transport system substrate-binding protein
MKRILAILCTAAILLAGCSKKENGLTAGSGQTRLVVWTDVDDVGKMVDNYYKPNHPDITIEYTFVPDVREKVYTILATGQGIPDIFSMEISSIGQYVDSDTLLDITDIYTVNAHKLYKYPVEIATKDDKVYALSWQTTAGATYYKRSLAKKYLGTDDPDTVQTYLANPEKFLETAALLKSKSNGTCYIVASYADLMDAFKQTRQNPWIVDNQLTIDPQLIAYMDTAKMIRDRGFDARIERWSEGWYASMNNIATDEDGNPIEVFGYFLPGWGLYYVLMAGAADTSGDWAIAPGPYPWFNGGTFLGAWNKTKAPDAAKEFISYFTTNDELLENWVANTFDMISNSNVVDKLKTTISVPFLGGQNNYAVFAPLTENISGRLVQGLDSAIDSIFMETVAAYVNGEKTKDRALADFRDQISTQYGY